MKTFTHSISNVSLYLLSESKVTLLLDGVNGVTGSPTMSVKQIKSLHLFFSSVEQHFDNNCCLIATNVKNSRTKTNTCSSLTYVYKNDNRNTDFLGRMETTEKRV